MDGARHAVRGKRAAIRSAERDHAVSVNGVFCHERQDQVSVSARLNELVRTEKMPNSSSMNVVRSTSPWSRRCRRDERLIVGQLTFVLFVDTVRHKLRSVSLRWSVTANAATTSVTPRNSVQRAFARSREAAALEGKQGESTPRRRRSGGSPPHSDGAVPSRAGAR
jgi:hypothetical protein